MSLRAWRINMQLRSAWCALGGHRDVVHIPHREVCERPWDVDHARATAQVESGLCRYCGEWTY